MTARGALQRLTGTGGYELRCDECARPGKTGLDPDELQSLADSHNHLLHRDQPVATVRNA